MVNLLGKGIKRMLGMACFFPIFPVLFSSAPKAKVVQHVSSKQATSSCNESVSHHTMEFPKYRLFETSYKTIFPRT